MCPRPLLAPGHRAPARRAGISAPSPPRPLPASFQAFPRLPPTRQTPQASRPQSQSPPRAEAPSAPPPPRAKVRREPPRPGPGLSGFPEALRAGGTTGHPHPATGATRLRGGRGERAGREGWSTGLRCRQGRAGPRTWGSDSRRLRPRGRVRRAAATGAALAALGLRRPASAGGSGGGESGPSAVPAVPAARGPGAAGTFILTRPAPGSA